MAVRTTQEALEVAVSVPPRSRITQLVLEALQEATGNRGRVVQEVLEVIIKPSAPDVHVSQFCLEVLVPR